MYNQNYNYYPQQASFMRPQQPQQMAPQVELRGRMVSSIEEARATPIDFDGSVFYFPDLANKKIYTKQINMDGTATINMYELKPIPVQQDNTVPSNYVTREEFEKALEQIKIALTPKEEGSKELLKF